MSGKNYNLYSVVETTRALLAPYRFLSQSSIEFFDNNILFNSKFSRHMSAYCELFERVTRQYDAPDFEIDNTIIDGKEIQVREQVVLEKHFCKLIQFKKESFDKKQEKLLIFAPMSGHNATLLRDTVKGFLPYFDVYITYWIDAKEVCITKGKFGLDDYIDYSIKFMDLFAKEGLNVLAVCQSVVPVLAAVSLIAEDKNKRAPKSLILMGGPVDARHSPTTVNKYADERDLKWFQSNSLSRVPSNYKGKGRLVNPGFLQVANFVSMNLEKHTKAHFDLFRYLVEDDVQGIARHKNFYDEYLAVSDISADFFIETIDSVFKKYSLPNGKMIWNERLVMPEKIKSTALLCIEGEKDDISGIGQTKAAIDLCKGISDDKKEYYIQEAVGHYGIFHGSRFRKYIVPEICSFIKKHNKSSLL